MAFIWLLLAILLFGLILLVIGGGLLLAINSKRAGYIVFGVGSDDSPFNIRGSILDSNHAHLGLS